MMYACRNRSKAIRRWLPLNQGARDILAKRDAGRNAGEDRICCGGAPARRGGLDQTWRRSRADRGGRHGLSPRRSSLPTRTRRARGRWRRPPPSARSCARRVLGTGAKTDLCGPRAGHGRRRHALLPLADPGADVGAVLVGPGRFAELSSQVGVAGPGDRASALRESGRVLAGHETGEAHEGSRLREPAPVEDLGREAERTDRVTPR